LNCSKSLTLSNRPGVDPSVLNSIPSPNPYILKTNLTAGSVDSPFGKLEGNSSYVFRASEIEPEQAAGGGGSVKIVDSRNFPVAKTIASSIVTLKPGALRELHWHPNVSKRDCLLVRTNVKLTHLRPKNGCTSSPAPRAPPLSSET
jgi:oxalate decarboxylase/phosphoglucose isomerase-like protein (cupin superfamily)